MFRADARLADFQLAMTDPFSSIDDLVEANNERKPTPHLDPHPDSLNALGAQLLHVALSLRKPADLWDVRVCWPYEMLFDGHDLLVHAFILEQMGKARFSMPVGEIPWSWNYRGFCIDKSVAVEWVEPSSTHMEYVYGRIAYPVLMRWRAQGEIKIADEQLGLVAAKFAELKETERLWREQKDRWVVRLASPPPAPEAEPT